MAAAAGCARSVGGVEARHRHMPGTRGARKHDVLRHNASMPVHESPALRALIDDRYAELAERCRAAGIPLHDDAGVAADIGQFVHVRVGCQAAQHLAGQ